MKSILEIINESEEPKVYSNMILLNQDKDKILVLQRANYMRKFKSLWGFPGGSVDKNDKNPKAAAIRELEEETGIKLSWKEEHDCKKYDSIKNRDGSISEYYITTLEEDKDIKLSKEHSRFHWFNDKSKDIYKWMPDVFQIIQKIL